MTFLEGMSALLNDLRLRQYSPATIDNYGDQLLRLGEWLVRNNLYDLRKLTRQHIDAYQTYVRQEPITLDTQALRLRVVKRLFHYLTDQGVMLLDPADGIREDRRQPRIPRPVLTRREMDKLLAAPDTTTFYGIRDRALIEVLYATGIRVGELEKVTLNHVNLPTQTLQVCYAKGGRPRTVPLGRTATAWLKDYMTDVRPRLGQRRPFEHHLFLVRGGKPLTQAHVRYRLQHYRKAALISKPVTPHILRHTCATHLLQNGADIRAIQQLLGHVSLTSTVTYTRVVPVDIKTTHNRYHPEYQ